MKTLGYLVLLACGVSSVATIDDSFWEIMSCVAIVCASFSLGKQEKSSRW